MVYTDYIDTLIEGIDTGLFDILGHTDLIKKPGDSLIDRVPEPIHRLLKSVRRAGMTIEINTSGYRKAAAETYPGLDWLPLLKRHHIPITIGSDAHTPDQVGLHFPAVYKEIRQQGFRTLSTYEKRRRMSVRLG
jgi:histidinol-phosphatase (PHP family)